MSPDHVRRATAHPPHEPHSALHTGQSTRAQQPSANTQHGGQGVNKVIALHGVKYMNSRQHPRAGDFTL